VSNLMPGEVTAVSGDTAELRLDSGVTVRTESLGAAQGERAHAVVRPEKLELSAAEDPPPGGRPSVEGVLESALYLGTATQVVVRLQDGTAMTVLVPNTDDAARRRMPNPGARVRLAWSGEHIHMVREAKGDAPAHAAEAA
jgi:spermidine/putrescine transport system ATP-binding protein